METPPGRIDPAKFAGQAKFAAPAPTPAPALPGAASTFR
jgi:hypothetical protein